VTRSGGCVRYKAAGKNLQFSDRQLQDGGDMGAQSFNFAPKFPSKSNILSPQFFLEILRQEENLPTG